MSKDAVVFTTTFYNPSEDGKIRKNLALEFTERVVKLGYPLIVLDGGTDDGKFIDKLKIIGANAYHETKRGLGHSRRESHEYALEFAKRNGIHNLIWSEPEKIGFVDSINYLVEQMEKTRADLIVPFRNSMESYPIAQWYSEAFGNQLFTDNEYLDINRNSLDQFFGPHVWNRRMAPYFQIFSDSRVAEVLAEVRIDDIQKKYGIQLSEEQKSFEIKKTEIDLLRFDHMMHMPTALMILMGENVISVPVDYVHPKNQTDLETRNQDQYNSKRLMQLNSLAEQFKLVKVLHKRGIFNEKLESMLKDTYFLNGKT